jgi:hypothetical protein
VTNAPGWQSLRKSVRAYLGNKIHDPSHAEDATQVSLLRLLERSAQGEAFKNPEGAAFREADHARFRERDARKAERRALADLRAETHGVRGRRIAAAPTSLDRRGDASLVCLPGDHPRRGRPATGDPKRRQKVFIYRPDGTTTALMTRLGQKAYKAPPAAKPLSLSYLVLAYGTLPPAPWDMTQDLRHLTQALDRIRWRDAESAIRSPRRRR